MKEKYLIDEVKAREILDSRGNPTVEVEVYCKDDVKGVAKVPSGASTGSFEAFELRDGKKRFGGKGVKNAVEKVETRIAESLVGCNVLEQKAIDTLLCKLDGTENKSKLGANSILGTSMAVADCASKVLEIPLYRYLGGVNALYMPTPMMNVINGGVHAQNKLDFQEFMIMPANQESYAEGLRMCTEVYHALKDVLKSHGHNTAVGDEGGFAPDLSSADEAFEYLDRAVDKAGYIPGEDIVYAMDAAASELYNKDTRMYHFPGENKIRDTEEMIDYYKSLLGKYELKSIEDGLFEDDWEGWRKMTDELGDKTMLVGDDLFVTNPKRLAKGIDEKCANSILVKMNQIGSLSDALEAIEMAKRAKMNTIISHRSGETEDTFIADLAVGTNSKYIKSGAPCRGERTSKYNRLLEIEEEINRYKSVK